ncbi:SDR family oxidoreductase [soil metagenome]
MSQDLVTGFPGFIGRRLVAALLERDPKTKVVALVERRMLETAREVADGIDSKRIEILPGDITERNLGLTDDIYHRLAEETDFVFHLAAIYDLSVPLELAQKVNVDGTGNVVDFCRACKDLKRHAYVSTAYVAGMRKGVVYEHELIMGQDFKNHYESTKFQAEVWVRESMDEVPTTVLRPAIVVGDSRTGETEKFDGPYYVLRALSRAQKMGRPLAQFGRGGAKFNVVPVDYVVAAMVAASDDEATLGHTLHLVDPDPLTASELVTLLSQTYAGKEPKGRVPAGLVERSLHLKFVRDLFEGTPPESIAYLNHPVTYDARRTVEMLAPHGLVPPKFPEYVENMVRFYREHEDDPRMKPKGPVG